MLNVTQDLPRLPRIPEPTKTQKGDLVFLVKGDPSTYIDKGDMYSIARVSHTKAIPVDDFEKTVHKFFALHDSQRSADNLQTQIIRYELIEPDMNEMFREEPSGETRKKDTIPKPTTISMLRRELKPVCRSPAVRSLVCSFPTAEACLHWIQENPVESGFLAARMSVTELIPDCFVYRCVEVSEDDLPRFEPVFLHACFNRPDESEFKQVVHLKSDLPQIKPIVNAGLEMEKGSIVFQHIATQTRMSLDKVVETVNKFYEDKFSDEYLSIPDSENQLKKALAIVRGQT